MGIDIVLNKKEPLKSTFYHLIGYCGVYKITNLQTGKFYIGSSETLDIRLYNHLRDLIIGEHHNNHLQSSFNKRGVDNYVYEILSICDKTVQIEQEQYFLDTLTFAQEYILSEGKDKRFKNTCYNLTPTAGKTTGYKFSEEQLLVSSKNTKKLWETEEYRGKQKAYNNLPETKIKKSNKTKEVRQRPGVVERMVSSTKKTKSTTEYKEKVYKIVNEESYKELHRKNTTALWKDPKYREKIHTPEAKEKRKNITTDKWEDKEYRRKQMETRSDPKLYERVVEKRKETQSKEGYVNAWFRIVLMKSSSTNELIQEFSSIKYANDFLMEKYKDIRLPRGYRKDADFLIQNNRILDGVYFEYKL